MILVYAFVTCENAQFASACKIGARFTRERARCVIASQFQFLRAAFVPSTTILSRYVGIDNFELISFHFFSSVESYRAYVSRHFVFETRSSETSAVSRHGSRRLDVISVNGARRSEWTVELERKRRARARTRDDAICNVRKWVSSLTDRVSRVSARSLLPEERQRYRRY